MRLHSVIVFQIYYLYINIDSLSQYIWTLVAPNYIELMRSYVIKYYVLYYITINILKQSIIELIKLAVIKW